MGRSKKDRGRKRRDNKSSAASAASAAQSTRTIGMPDPAMATAMSLASTCLNGGIQVAAVGENGGVSWVYSDNHGNGRPEYFVDNVPEAKVRLVVSTINFVADITNVGHRHSIRGCGNLLLWFNRIDEGDTKESLLAEKCLYMNHFSVGAPIYELRPLFACSVADDWWGGRPPAPNAQETMVDEILRTWEEQRSFHLDLLCPVSEMGDEVVGAMRTLFHDVDEVGLDNIRMPRQKRVDLAVALKRMDDWKVDWDKNLNGEQIEFVKEHVKYFRRIARVLFRAKPICDHCGALEDLMICSGCKSTHYCSRECQRADRETHRELCQATRSMRNDELYVKPIQTVH